MRRKLAQSQQMEEKQRHAMQVIAEDRMEKTQILREKAKQRERAQQQFRIMNQKLQDERRVQSVNNDHNQKARFKQYYDTVLI